METSNGSNTIGMVQSTVRELSKVMSNLDNMLQQQHPSDLTSASQPFPHYHKEITEDTSDGVDSGRMKNGTESCESDEFISSDDDVSLKDKVKSADFTRLLQQHQSLNNHHTYSSICSNETNGESFGSSKNEIDGENKNGANDTANSASSNSMRLRRGSKGNVFDELKEKQRLPLSTYDSDVIDDLMRKKQKLETELKEATRTVDLLQEELNDKHLQLSALKSRLDGTSCLDINQLKSSISDLKRMLTAEQEKSEHLLSKIDRLQSAVDEKNTRISQLVNELNQFEAEKGSLECEAHQLKKDKQFLIDEKLKLEQKLEDMVMDREFSAEEARIRLQDSEDVMIPRLMKLIISDKNDEINELTSQLKEIEIRIAVILPFAREPSNPISLVDELINNYLSLKNKDDLQFNLKSPVQMFSQCQSLPPSPKRSTYDGLISSNKSSSSSKIVRNDDQSNSHELESEMLELQLKCDKMYFAMSNLKEENEILRMELENLREERLPIEYPPINCGKNVDMMDKDSDFIDEEDSIEDALIKIHKQSAEIFALSETTKASHDTIIHAIIDILPSILLDENDEEFESHDGLRYNGLNNYMLRYASSEKMQVFLDKFSNKNLGIKLLEKLLEIKKVYTTALEKIKFYVTQNETISGQLSTVEDALIQAQAKLDGYQKKYDKIKKKLKELNSNGKITQTSNNNIHNVNSNNHHNNLNSHPSVNSINKVKVDHCSNSELYHQYRTCLSHRNSLIYQKKYLLNVLGGYQLTERATLALLANLNVTTNESYLHSPGRIRFKSVVVAVIAIRRINHIRLKHSSYSKKIEPQLVTQASKVTVLPSTFHVNLPSNSTASEPMAISQASSSLKCAQTNATIKEFVSRLQRLHRTLGLHYEARYSATDLLISDDQT